MYYKPIFEIWPGQGVHLYGIMIGIGLIVCLLTFYFTMTFKGVDKKVTNTYIDLAIVSIIIGFGSAMLFQGIYNAIDTGSFLDENGGVGMTFIGGLIGGAVTFIIGMLFVIKKEKREAIPIVVEIAAPCIVIAHAFGRIGCFFAGCCWGKPTDGPLGMIFANPQVGTAPVIPTQLIEAIFLFCLYAVLMFLVLKDIRWSLITYLFAYGIFRFTIEFYRSEFDGRGAFIPGISPSQAWTLLMIVIVGALIFLKFRPLKRNPFWGKFPISVIMAGTESADKAAVNAAVEEVGKVDEAIGALEKPQDKPKVEKKEVYRDGFDE